MLRDGGGLALSVWGSLKATPGQASPAAPSWSTPAPPLPIQPLPESSAMADPERTRSLLVAARLEVRRWENLELLAVPGLRCLLALPHPAGGAMALSIATLPDEEQRALRVRVEVAVAPYRSNDAYEMPGLAQNTLAA